MADGDLITWMKRLRVGQGDGVGDRFRVLPWQREFIEKTFAPDVKEAALSVPRGVGKSTLIGAIAAAAVIGPLRVKNGEVIVCAASFAQAKIVFGHALEFVTQACGGELLRREWQWQDTAQKAMLKSKRWGASIRCIGSKPRTAHGLAPRLICADEPAQWEHNTSQQMIAVLRTSLGKVPGARLFSIGTRPADQQHWFAHALRGGADVSVVYSYESEKDWWTEAAAKAANPSWDYFPTLREVTRAEAKRAVQDTELEAAYRALRLNAGMHETAIQMVCSTHTWKAIETDSPPEARGPHVAAIDVGGAAAMTAWASYWPETGRIEAMAAFPSEPGLRARGMSDGVGDKYTAMQNRGELVQYGSKVLDYEAFLTDISSRLGRPDVLVIDRYKALEVQEVMAKVGLRARLSIRGQGFKDGAEDLRRFRKALLEQRLRVFPSLLIRTSLSSARCVSDVAGNTKLSKGTQGGRRFNSRDDVVSALIMAVAEGERRYGQRGRGFKWRVA